MFCKSTQRLGRCDDPMCHWVSTRDWKPPFTAVMHAKGARQCLGYKSNASFTLFAGDSTTRDLFYEVASMLGVPLVGAAWTGKDRRPCRIAVWAETSLDGAWATAPSKKKCVRHLTFSNRHRVGFLFLDGGNATYETHLIRDVPTTVVLQCPIYHFYKPHAYDYTHSASDRARVNASGFSIDAHTLRSASITFPIGKRADPESC